MGKKVKINQQVISVHGATTLNLLPKPISRKTSKVHDQGSTG